MNTVSPLVNIDRLNNLIAEKPNLAVELGLIEAPQPDLITIPPTILNLRTVQTGQALLMTGAKGFTVRLEMWTTPHFDFQKKEWAEDILLDRDGKGSAKGVSVELKEMILTISSYSDRLQLPPLADKFSNGSDLVGSYIGHSRFSVRPSRIAWVTGEMVWL